MSATPLTPSAPAQSAPRGPSFAERAMTFAKACFDGPANTALTLACIAVLYFAVPPFWAWAVTNATWKAKNFFHGPINGDTANPQFKQEPLPANWWAVDFDDSTWKNAKEYTVEEVDPKQPYFENDFEGAKFIWTDDIALDNTVIFRTKIEKTEWKQRWNTKPDLDVIGVPTR